MKYCPTCETRYDEEILRFCMKDGTPLIEEGEPKFTEMPSESLDAEDDPGEVTIIRKKGEIPIPPPQMDEAGEFQPPEPEYRPKEEPVQRIVVPMQQPQRFQPQARVIPPYQPPPKSNTFKVVVLTALGTVLLLGAGALGFWLLTGGTASNTNTNANNTNANGSVNTNLGYDANFNFNAPGSFDANSNVNANANAKSPTPTPKPSPSTTPSPSPSPTLDDDNATPTPRPSPSVPTMLPANRTTSPTPPRMMPANRAANRPANGN